MPNIKYQQLCLQLKTELRNGTYRQRLPGLRTLAQTYGVNKTTMSKALRPLVEQGILIPSPGGTQITQLAQKRDNFGIVTVITADHERISLDLDPLALALKTAAAEEHYELIFVRIESDALSQQLEFWDAKFSDGFIFLYSTFYNVLFRHLAIRKVPFVSANFLSSGSDHYWVDFDHRKHIFELVGELLKRGYRRIAFLCYEQYAMGSADCFDLWNDLCSAFDLFNYTPRPEFFRRLPLNVLKSWYHDREPMPELILCSDNPVGSVRQMAALLDRWHAPSRLAILSGNGCEHIHPRILRRQGPDYAQLGRQVWNLFQSVRQGNAGPPGGRLVAYPVIWLDDITRPNPYNNHERSPIV